MFKDKMLLILQIAVKWNFESKNVVRNTRFLEF